MGQGQQETDSGQLFPLRAIDATGGAGELPNPHPKTCVRAAFLVCLAPARADTSQIGKRARRTEMKRGDGKRTISAEDKRDAGERSSSVEVERDARTGKRERVQDRHAAA